MWFTLAPPSFAVALTLTGTDKSMSHHGHPCPALVFVYKTRAGMALACAPVMSCHCHVASPPSLRCRVNGNIPSPSLSPTCSHFYHPHCQLHPGMHSKCSHHSRHPSLSPWSPQHAGATAQCMNYFVLLRTLQKKPIL